MERERQMVGRKGGKREADCRRKGGKIKADGEKEKVERERRQ